MTRDKLQKRQKIKTQQTNYVATISLHEMSKMSAGPRNTFYAK